jgi:hypothetical protein
MGTLPLDDTEIDARRTRRLRHVIWAAAIVDLVLAGIIFFPPAPILEATRIPIGEPPMYLRFAGLLLVILPIFYMTGARSSALAPPITRVAIAARCLGVVFLLFHVLAEGAPVSFAGFAALDGTFALLHALALGAWRRSAGYTNV